jgi:hypothetical protein
MNLNESHERRLPGAQTCVDDGLKTSEDAGDVWPPPGILIPTLLGEPPNRWTEPKWLTARGFLWSLPP